MIIKNIIILIRKYLNFLYVWLVREKWRYVGEKSGNLDILCEWQPCINTNQYENLSLNAVEYDHIMSKHIESSSITIQKRESEHAIWLCMPTNSQLFKDDSYRLHWTPEIAIIGYGQLFILQYIYHIKLLATLRLCVKFQNFPPLQSIILFGHFWSKNINTHAYTHTYVTTTIYHIIWTLLIKKY